jgi:hypothetical protein
MGKVASDSSRPPNSGSQSQAGDSLPNGFDPGSAQVPDKVSRPPVGGSWSRFNTTSMKSSDVNYSTAQRIVIGYDPITQQFIYA